MIYLKLVALIFILCSPQLLAATEQDQHRYTPKDQIEFTEATTTAFDHSGKSFSRSVHLDGSVAVDNNGSAGNVTVARLGPDGKIETFCTTDIAIARSWLAGEGVNQTTVAIDSPVMEK